VGSGSGAVSCDEGVRAEIEPFGRTPQVHGQAGEGGRGQAERGAKGAPVRNVRGRDIAVLGSVGREGDEEVVDGTEVLHVGAGVAEHGHLALLGAVGATMVEASRGRIELYNRVHI
jgi:hypothetical protein